jgi:hypothetical protein
MILTWRAKVTIIPVLVTIFESNFYLFDIDVGYDRVKTQILAVLSEKMITFMA